MITEPQLRLGPDEHSITLGGGATAGLVPAAIINNALLRQHFRLLTMSFLKPFGRFFHVDASRVASMLLDGSVGAYDDFAVAFLPKFVEEVWTGGRSLRVCISGRLCAFRNSFLN